MHIALISGSHRQNSQSERIAHYLADQLSKLNPDVTTDVISLAGNPLPLWDEDMWKPDTPLQKQWAPYAKRLSDAHGFIIVAAEWSGMVPAGLKNFFLYCSAKEVGHKAALIVGVSSSHGGAYPVDELRGSSYKNTKICYMPDHLIVRNCEKIFVGDQGASEEDTYMRERAVYSLKLFVEYTRALASVRSSGLTFDKKFPFGM